MKKMKVSKKIIGEFNALKTRLSEGNYANLFNAMNTIDLNPEEYKALRAYLFNDYSEQMEENQIAFAKAWAGKVELVTQEYLVRFNNKSRKEFIYKNDDGDFSSMVIEPSIAGLPNDVPSYHFDEEIAFKLRDTGLFEIEKVED